MAKKDKEPSPVVGGYVRPCERAPGKFEAVLHDGSVDPYAYRTEAEAQAAVDKSK